MFLGGSFLKLADDDVLIENPKAQNRAQNTPKSDFKGPKIPPRGASST